MTQSEFKAALNKALLQGNYLEVYNLIRNDMNYPTADMLLEACDQGGAIEDVVFALVSICHKIEGFLNWNPRTLE